MIDAQKSETIDSPFGQAVYTLRQEGDSFVVQNRLRIQRSEISAQEYEAFRSFLVAVDKRFSSGIVLVR